MAHATEQKRIKLDYKNTLPTRHKNIWLVSFYSSELPSYVGRLQEDFFSYLGKPRKEGM